MAEDALGAEESTQPRSKEVIRQELVEAWDESERYKEEGMVLFSVVETLPDDQQELIEGELKRFVGGEISVGEVNLPLALEPKAAEIKDWLEKGISLRKREEDLYREDLPHKRAEFEERLKALASRIDYEAVFSYYRKVETRSIARLG